MYLIGENSIDFPWYMPKDFPQDALTGDQKENFLKFIRTEQWTFNWTFK